MSFGFGFSGDDIEDDGTARSPRFSFGADMPHTSEPTRQRIDTIKHSVLDMLSSLPSRIAYTTISLLSPKKNRHALIPRRALFDIRLQIMAEADTHELQRSSSGSYLNLEAIQCRKDSTFDTGQEGRPLFETGLGNLDIEQDIYEGGFKCWEGGLDLALSVLDDRVDVVEGRNCASPAHIVELGCGAAIPSLVLYQAALRTRNIKTKGSPTFTLTDYNASVIRLVTLPNFLLVWALENAQDAFSPAAPSTLTGTSEVMAMETTEGELKVTPQLILAFQQSLTTDEIKLHFVSGPWSPLLSDIVLNHTNDAAFVFEQQDVESNKQARITFPVTFVLAAETIYSPSSLASFTDCLIALLRSGISVNNARHAKLPALALIAAKKLYFGVGGSVEDFIALARKERLMVREILDTGVAGVGSMPSHGVRRWIGEVSLDSRAIVA